MAAEPWAAASLRLRLPPLVSLDTLELSPGQPVWVTGAAGSLAWFVIQFALQRNLQVVAIGRDHDVELLRSIGVQTKERIRWVP